MLAQVVNFHSAPTRWSHMLAKHLVIHPLIKLTKQPHRRLKLAMRDQPKRRCNTGAARSCGPMENLGSLNVLESLRATSVSKLRREWRHAFNCAAPLSYVASIFLQKILLTLCHLLRPDFLSWHHSRRSRPAPCPVCNRRHHYLHHCCKLF